MQSEFGESEDAKQDADNDFEWVAADTDSSCKCPPESPQQTAIPTMFARALALLSFLSFKREQNIDDDSHSAPPFLDTDQGEQTPVEDEIQPSSPVTDNEIQPSPTIISIFRLPPRTPTRTDGRSHRSRRGDSPPS
uniref:Uncharacterized protein n=1 Tax=Cryptomonas curvata TaxID=233186 RepID=A0A6T8ASV9_9CRYP|mmetsp:Transcript_45850/g.96031  ORF Transcript_45850/g.96031 Transcript_45850/m.96031 type:complete len:136 (+) Transcript_45850:60-467(+)